MERGDIQKLIDQIQDELEHSPLADIRPVPPTFWQRAWRGLSEFAHILMLAFCIFSVLILIQHF